MISTQVSLAYLSFLSMIMMRKFLFYMKILFKMWFLCDVDPLAIQLFYDFYRLFLRENSKILLQGSFQVVFSSLFFSSAKFLWWTRKKMGRLKLTFFKALEITHKFCCKHSFIIFFYIFFCWCWSGLLRSQLNFNIIFFTSL